MSKTFQISSRPKTRVIVRTEDKPRRDYNNLTWSTLHRLDQLTHRPDFKTTTVCLKQSVDIFIAKA